MKFEPGSWQEQANTYDHKAHKRNGIIKVTFSGSFRGMRIEEVASGQLSVVVPRDNDDGHGVVVEDLSTWFTNVMLPEAADLDRRIRQRRNQKPIERQYLYGS